MLPITAQPSPADRRRWPRPARPRRWRLRPARRPPPAAANRGGASMPPARPPSRRRRSPTEAAPARALPAAGRCGAGLATAPAPRRRAVPARRRRCRTWQRRRRAGPVCRQAGDHEKSRRTSQFARSGGLKSWRWLPSSRICPSSASLGISAITPAQLGRLDRAAPARPGRPRRPRRRSPRRHRRRRATSTPAARSPPPRRPLEAVRAAGHDLAQRRQVGATRPSPTAAWWPGAVGGAHESATNSVRGRW